MTSVPIDEPPPRQGPGRRLSTFFYRHPRIRLVGAPRAAGRVARARLLRVARSCCSCRPSGRPIRSRARSSTSFTLENFERIIETPVYRDVACADDPDGRCGDGRLTRSSPSRSPTTWRASRRRRTREPPRRRRPRAALGELSREGVRVADDPLRRRRHQLGPRARSDSRSTGCSKVGLWLVFTYLWLPFMILPIYAGLERIPSSLLEASADLGGRSAHDVHARHPAARFPAVVAGSIFTFSLTLGDYIAPALIASEQFIGTVIYSIRGEPRSRSPRRTRWCRSPSSSATCSSRASSEAFEIALMVESRVTRVLLRLGVGVRRSRSSTCRSSIIGLYAFNGNITQAWPIEEWSTQVVHGRVRRTRTSGRRSRTRLSSALAATAIALVLGTLASMAVSRYRFFGREVVTFAVILPIALPGIITGLALQATIIDVLGPLGRRLRSRRRSSSATRPSASSSSTTTCSRGCGGRRRLARRGVGGPRRRQLADVPIRHVPADADGAARRRAARVRALVRRGHRHDLHVGRAADAPDLDLREALPRPRSCRSSTSSRSSSSSSRSSRSTSRSGSPGRAGSRRRPDDAVAASRAAVAQPRGGDAGADRAGDARAAEPAVAVRVRLEVLLVVVLGVVERPRLDDLGRDRAVAGARELLLEHVARGERGVALRLRRPVDARSGTACRRRCPGACPASGRGPPRRRGASPRSSSSRCRTRRGRPRCAPSARCRPPGTSGSACSPPAYPTAVV